MLPEVQPGCYGSPLCCILTRSPCSDCRFASACYVAATERAERLKTKYGIALTATAVNERRSSSLPAVAPVAPATPVPSVVTTAAPIEPRVWPRKSVDLVERLNKRGVDLKRATEMRVNPFEITTPVFMRIVMDSLLKGGFDRSSLKNNLMKILGWSEGTAASHVGISISTLLATGAAIETGGRLIPFDAVTA
jgi:hypothetical protein